MQIYDFGMSIDIIVFIAKVKLDYLCIINTKNMKRLFMIAGLLLILLPVSFSQTAAEWNKQGVDHSKKFEYKQAYECFTKAIELNPEFAEAFYNRATVWFELPANAFPNGDGCADLKKAKSLGFKVKDEAMKNYGCL